MGFDLDVVPTVSLDTKEVVVMVVAVVDVVELVLMLVVVVVSEVVEELAVVKKIIFVPLEEPNVILE